MTTPPATVDDINFSNASLISSDFIERLNPADRELAINSWALLTKVLISTQPTKYVFNDRLIEKLKVVPEYQLLSNGIIAMDSLMAISMYCSFEPPPEKVPIVSSSTRPTLDVATMNKLMRSITSILKYGGADAMANFTGQISRDIGMMDTAPDKYRYMVLAHDFVSMMLGHSPLAIGIDEVSRNFLIAILLLNNCVKLSRIGLTAYNELYKFICTGDGLYCDIWPISKELLIPALSGTIEHTNRTPGISQDTDDIYAVARIHLKLQNKGYRLPDDCTYIINNSADIKAINQMISIMSSRVELSEFERYRLTTESLYSDDAYYLDQRYLYINKDVECDDGDYYYTFIDPSGNIKFPGGNTYKIATALPAGKSDAKFYLPVVNWYAFDASHALVKNIEITEADGTTTKFTTWFDKISGTPRVSREFVPKSFMVVNKPAAIDASEVILFEGREKRIQTCKRGSAGSYNTFNEAYDHI